MSKKIFGDTNPSASQSERVSNSKPEASSDSPLLLKLNQVAYLLNIGPKGALKLLATYGIQPIDYGRGRGKGLRWYEASVRNLADILHITAQAKAPKPKKTFSSYSVVGKSASELFAEFNGDGKSPTEVRNGN